MLADVVEAAKIAAVKAVEASKPSGVYFGTVTSVSPLKINVEQKMTLESAQLILARNVTDHTVQMTIGNTQTYYWTGTEENPIPVDVGHKHAIGKGAVTVHNGLVNGDKVILLRVQGGQKYVVLDRVT